MTYVTDSNISDTSKTSKKVRRFLQIFFAVEKNNKQKPQSLFHHVTQMGRDRPSGAASQHRYIVTSEQPKSFPRYLVLSGLRSNVNSFKVFII